MDKRSRSQRVARELARNRSVYLMLAPVLAYFIVFQYVPMAGAVIAFKDFERPASWSVDAWREIARPRTASITAPW
jgi:putative aldouronate transport system permease protein